MSSVVGHNVYSRTWACSVESGGSTLRTFPVVAAAALVLTPLVAASVPNAALVTDLPDGGRLLTWTPAPGATLYVVYAGDAPDHMVRVDSTSEPFYLDESGSAPLSSKIAWTSVLGDGSTMQGSHGSCIEMSSDLHVWVTIANCVRI
jgi:hypothetical protein